MKNDVLQFLASQNLCVMATTDERGQPEAALVGFSESQDLELLIGTSNRSRKYQNLKERPEVAIVIGFGTDATVQYEGMARELSADEVESYLETHFQKLPGATKFVKSDDQVWLLITPQWLRYTVHGDPQRVEELRDFS